MAQEQHLDCHYCGSELPPIRSGDLPRRGRVAFDPDLGRLWQVCGSCERWNAVPIEDRWEVLEQCERARGRATVLLESDHLTLLSSGRVQLIRVGNPTRSEFSVWRYSAYLDRFRQRQPLAASLLALPDRPVGGAIGRDYHGGVVTVPPAWIGSAFLEHGGLLTLLFSVVPLAGNCPACGRPLMLDPSRFGELRIELSGGAAVVRTACPLCGTTVDTPLGEARPALRTGLAVVNRQHRRIDRVRLAVRPIDNRGSAAGFVEGLARRGAILGSLRPRLRLALWLALDEMAEAESLENEWRRAEELASIADGELTEVPGFEEFRKRVRSSLEDPGQPGY